jgi:hypothetical protein
MTQYKEKIVNIETNEETWRDFTPEEIAEIERAQAKAAEIAAKESEALAAKAALLEKLGITEDEAKLLLS